MTLSNPITVFGVHQITLEDRATHDLFTALVLGDFSFDNSQEQIELRGGSSPYPWDAADADAEAGNKVTFLQYDLNLLKFLAGVNSTIPNYTEDTDGDAAGAVSDFANLIGTSCKHATTGIASIAPKSALNPVYGTYFIKVVSATTVDVYLDNNLDGLTYVNDSLKITASPLTIPGTGGTVDVPGANLTITGGSGTVGMTTGDMASFFAKPINNYNNTYNFGAPGASKPTFAMRVFTEKLGSKYRTLYFPKVRANGVSFNMPRKDWSSFETEIKVLFDPAAGYACQSRIVGRD